MEEFISVVVEEIEFEYREVQKPYAFLSLVWIRQPYKVNNDVFEEKCSWTAFLVFEVQNGLQFNGSRSFSQNTARIF